MYEAWHAAWFPLGEGRERTARRAMRLVAHMEGIDMAIAVMAALLLGFLSGLLTGPLRSLMTRR